jgi:hypothetical protein
MLLTNRSRGNNQPEPDHAPLIGIQIMASTLPAGRLNGEWLEADGLVAAEPADAIAQPSRPRVSLAL